MAVSFNESGPHVVNTRIAFLGNPGYGGLLLEELLRSEVDVVGIFSTTTRFWPRIRRRYLRYLTSRRKVAEGVRRVREKIDSLFDEQETPEQFGKAVIPIALQHGIRTFDGSDVRNPACHEILRRLEVDVILVATFGEFLPPEMLRIPRLAAINMHPSLLPKYRGGFPEFAAVLNGESATGVTFHLMEAKFDAGNILLQRRLQILEHETTVGLKRRLAALACDAFPELLSLIMRKHLTGCPQDSSAVSYCRLTPYFDRVTPAMTVRQIQNIINACHDVEDIGRPHFLLGGERLQALSYGAAGLPFAAADGTICFDRIRYRHKILAGDDLRSLARRLGIGTRT